MMPKKPPAAPVAGDERNQSSSRPPSASAAGHEGQTYTVNIVQTLRVTSDRPLTPNKLDAMKKSLGNLGDQGSVPGNEAGKGYRVAVVQQALEVIGAESSSPSPPPSPPPRYSISSGAPRLRGDQQKQMQAEQPPGPILFYHVHDPYYEFTNFSPDKVEYKGKLYPTSEHLFQSLKFLKHRPELAEHIRTCSPRPRVVFDETHRFNPEVRRDWLHVRVAAMDFVLWHKFAKNDRLRQLLLSTGDAELVEDSDKDAFWGVGPDRKGENQLGKALQRLRAKLRDGVSAEPPEP